MTYLICVQCISPKENLLLSPSEKLGRLNFLKAISLTLFIGSGHVTHAYINIRTCSVFVLAIC